MVGNINQLIKSTYTKMLTNRVTSDLLFRPGSEFLCLAWYIEISPEEVENISIIPESADSLIGQSARIGICDGHWDSFKRPFGKHIISRTAGEVVKRIPYHQTAIFKSVHSGRRSGNIALSTYKKLTRLRDVLLRDGYRSQYQLKNLEKTRNLGPLCIPRHEIVVGMDRNGKLMRLVGGKHRLAIAQHIGIKRIPAILSIVHENAVDMIPERSRPITGNPEDFRPLSVPGLKRHQLIY